MGRLQIWSEIELSEAVSKKLYALRGKTRLMDVLL